eukprot:14554020-Ditylum_brightwellii.AAC.1
MGGVDVVVQCISYYIPNHCCHRNGLPMFLQVLAIIRNNCYVVHKDYHGPKKNGHKLLTLSLIEDLVAKAPALTTFNSLRILITSRLPIAYPNTPSQVSSPTAKN